MAVLTPSRVSTVQVPFDNQTNTGTVDIPVPANVSNGMIVVKTAIRGSSTVTVSCQLASGGGPLTVTQIRAKQNGTAVGVDVSRAMGPTAGQTYRVTAAMSGFAYRGVKVELWQDVDQATPIGAIVDAIGTDTHPTVTVVSAVQGQTVTDAVCAFTSAGEGAPAIGTGQSLSGAALNATQVWGLASTEPGAASVVMDWTTVASHQWAAVGFPILGATAGAAPTGTVTIQTNKLELKTPAGVAGYVGAIETNPYDLRQSYFLAELQTIGTQAANRFVELGVWEDIDNRYYFELVNNVLKARHRSGGVQQADIGSVAYNATNHRWLQLYALADGSQIVWKSSADGITWADPDGGGAWFATPDIDLSAVSGALRAGQTGAVATTTVVFDNVNVTPSGTLPVNTSLPQITGVAQAQQTLQATTGVWTGTPAPTFTYQWELCDAAGASCGDISGATGQQYFVDPSAIGGTIRVRVTATNAVGSQSAESAATAVVLAALPVNLTPPVISGTARQGEQLDSTPGTWSNSPTAYTYQWQRCDPGGVGCFDIAGATSSTYVVGAADVGDHSLRVIVTASNTGGSATAASEATPVIVPAPVVPPPRITQLLGCGQYEVIIQPRGGGNRVVSLPSWSTISWQRTLDDTSQATIGLVVGVACPELAGIEPWSHEVAIQRDGVIVWAGPITQMPAPPETPQLTARDLTAWWDHRFVHTDHDHSESAADLAAIFQEISYDAMLPDNTPGLTVTSTPAGVLGTTKVLASEFRMAGQVLRDLAQAGVDWTVIGRSVIAGGLTVPAVSLGTMTDGHFTSVPKVTLDGLAQASKWAVVGGNTTDGQQVVGEAENTDASRRYGLLESSASISTILDSESATKAAESRAALTAAVRLVEAAVLIPDAPFPIEALVPGALAHLNLSETEVPVDDDFRLQQIDVSVDGQDESVRLTFQPVGGA